MYVPGIACDECVDRGSIMSICVPALPPKLIQNHRPAMDRGRTVLRPRPSHDFFMACCYPGDARRGVCTSCSRMAPDHHTPMETIVAPLRGNNAVLLCDWCSRTRRVHRLGQRLSPTEPSHYLLLLIMHAILHWLLWLLGRSHDEDEELVEYEVHPDFWGMGGTEP